MKSGKVALLCLRCDRGVRLCTASWDGHFLMNVALRGKDWLEPGRPSPSDSCKASASIALEAPGVISGLGQVLFLPCLHRGPHVPVPDIWIPPHGLWDSNGACGSRWLGIVGVSTVPRDRVGTGAGQNMRLPPDAYNTSVVGTLHPSSPTFQRMHCPQPGSNSQDHFTLIAPGKV